MRQTAEDLIEAAAVYAKRAAGGDDTVASFVVGYLRHLDRSDLAERSAVDLAGVALEHHRLAQRWQPGETVVSVANPRAHVDGWESLHTVVMIVTDDIPFLVSSVTMALARHELGIHLVAHPVFRDHRAIDGGFADPVVVEANGKSSASLIMLEVDRLSDPAAIDALTRDVSSVVGDVRLVVGDWRAMRDEMIEVADALDIARAVRPGHAEAMEFLRWLVDDHFTFMGVRDHAIETDTDMTAEGLVMRPLGDSGLGLLRDPAAPFDLLPVDRSVDEKELASFVTVTKSSHRSCVHRAGFMDQVAVARFGPDGEVVGQRRFLGLFSSEAYRRSVVDIPIVKGLVAGILERSDYPAGGHDAKRLLSALETYPRDELFEVEADELLPIVLGITQLQERRRVRVFERRERYGRFVTVLVYLPRDRYTTASRTAIEAALREAYDGDVIDWNAMVGESVLARLVFTVQLDAGPAPAVDLEVLEDDIGALIRGWDDDLAERLSLTLGEDIAVRHARRFGGRFPAGYQATNDARAAVADIVTIAELLGDDPSGADGPVAADACVDRGDRGASGGRGTSGEGAISVRCYRRPGRPDEEFGVKLFHVGAGLSLTELMPTLGNLGLIVLDEQPHRVEALDAPPVWIYDFTVSHPGPPLSFERVAELIGDTVESVLAGRLADDGFNRLVLATGLDARDVSVLRSCARYLRQVSIPFSQAYIEAALVRHAGVARKIFEVFATRFDPSIADVDAELAVPERVLVVLGEIEAIESLDDDRILRAFLALVMAMTRTTYYQREPDGSRRPYLAHKIEPAELEGVPEPRPRFEIYVHSPRMEGVHLRAGPVSRGGLRWSERLEDYRTEILGLLKAQIVKNAVIVPEGAKGGFVAKELPDDPAERRAEVTACYRLFVSGLLALTDDLVDGEVRHPEATRCLDGDDPYLVVAADKGTATFSDLANEIAATHGFWLDDAFASGGSNGYDHKAMGITARGAWESVLRHFRELGRDIATESFTVVGIGDMSGDVFGNGMLLSEQIKLIAAFDHRHVFIDPDPDPVVSHAERRRLFALAGSSWSQYDRSLLSFGGAIHPRSAKSITLSGPACLALGLEQSVLTPDEVISAILRAPVDVLWNGGIGTYVKGSSEAHLDVGDKANDAIRVNGRDVRASIIGEGGNLGVTQRGRIEFARHGGRIFTDAIDNSAGVDCSDHEVNIKILLDAAVARGELTMRERNELLVEMTGEVAELVLTHNRSQTLALSVACVQARHMTDVHARYIHDLEADGLISRELEALPDAEELAERRLAGEGLTAPELAVLLAVGKNRLSAELVAGDAPDLASVADLAVRYFPTPLRERFGAGIASHPLRREIIANRIANGVLDRAGTTMVYRLAGETGASSLDLALAHLAAWRVFDLEPLWQQAAQLGHEVAPAAQIDALLAIRRLGERATRWFVRQRAGSLDPGLLDAEFGPTTRATTAALADLVTGTARRDIVARVRTATDAGIDEELAWRLAVLEPAISVLDIVEVAHGRGLDARGVASQYFAVAAALDLYWLHDRIDDLPRTTRWEALARLSLRGDLESLHARIADAVATTVGTSSGDVVPDADRATDLVDHWLADRGATANRYLGSIADLRAGGRTELAALLVACGELAELAP